MSENTHNTQDFRVFSLSIEFLTTLYGLFMVIWGISISLISGSSSITSMIPAFIGVPLAFIGFIMIGVIIGYIISLKSVFSYRSEISKLVKTNKEISEELDGLRNVAVGEEFSFSDKE